MNEKKWYQSKTVLSSIVVVALSILSAFGFVLPEDVTQETITNNIVAIVTALAGLVAIFGRVTAKTTIKTGKGSKVASLLILLLCVSGCSDLRTVRSNPKAEVTAAVKVYEGVIVSLNELKEGGILKGDRLTNCQRVAIDTKIALDKWGEYVIENNKRPETADATLLLIKQLRSYLE